MIDAAQLAVLEACKRNRVFPEWLLERYGIKPRKMFESADQAFKRQWASIGWAIAEETYNEHLAKLIE